MVSATLKLPADIATNIEITGRKMIPYSFDYETYNRTLQTHLRENHYVRQAFHKNVSTATAKCRSCGVNPSCCVASSTDLNNKPGLYLRCVFSSLSTTLWYFA